MNVRFTIARKIGVGFGSLIFLTFVAFWLTLATLTNSRNINAQITNLYTPSVSALRELNILVIRSKMLITNWVNIQQTQHEDKARLRKLIRVDYPILKKRTIELSVNWNKDDQETITTIFKHLDELLALQQYIMSQLSSFDDYNEPSIIFSIRPMVEDADGEVNEKIRKILNSLTALIAQQNDQSQQKNREMLESFYTLQLVVEGLGIALPILGLLIALFTSRTIVKPIDEIKELLLRMARGILSDIKIKEGNDEIGEMSLALNRLVDTMKFTTEFAREIGSGNFNSFYKPLSDEDSLGQALVKMREDLRINERMLENKVAQRTAEVVSQKAEIELQSQHIQVLYKQVTASIRYAKRIQEAILPPDTLIKKLIPDSFVYYKPKDIVSGDFYWLEQIGNKILFAAVDCTGHGVPGAFMSIVGYNLLKQVTSRLQTTTPSVILDELSKGVSETLHQRNYEDSTTKDGMDITLCALDPATYELEFASAYNPLFLVRNNEIFEIKGNKFPIGIFLEKESRKFTNHKMKVQKEDVIYIFSDGYADQFGGPRGKKFMQTRFRNMLLGIHKKPMTEQRSILDKTLEEWRNNEDQVDDILIIGMRVN